MIMPVFLLGGYPMLLFYVLFLLPIVAAVSALLYVPFAIRTRRRLGNKGAL